MELYDFLSSFHTIKRDDYDKLKKNLKTVSFSKGENITVPGLIQKNLYFVQSGVQMSFTETDKKLHVIAFTYFPSLCAIPESFFFQKPSPHFLTCLTDSSFEYISFNELQSLFDQSQSLERLFRKITEYVLVGILQRHVELHSLTIEERFRVFCERSPHLLHLVPHKYLASYLHMDATNFSKLFNTIKV